MSGTAAFGWFGSVVWKPSVPLRSRGAPPFVTSHCTAIVWLALGASVNVVCEGLTSV